MGQINELKDFTRGQLDAALMKIGQDVGMGTADGINAFLAGELVVVRPRPTIMTLCTLRLGIGIMDAEGFRSALQSAGCEIGTFGADILDKPAFKVSLEAMEVELCVASVAELGFKNGAKYGAICLRIKELGYDLCPNEVGPKLRLQYKDQPKGECLHVAMEPITGSDSKLHMFCVQARRCGLWLYGLNGNPDNYWFDHDRFVFIRRPIVQQANCGTKQVSA